MQKKKHETMKDKKGISPLIATILVIGFTVALAAVIMTWGQSFVKVITEGAEQSKEEQLTCAQKVAFEILDVCDPGNDYEVLVTLSNTGSVQIDSFSVRLFGTEAFTGDDFTDSKSIITPLSPLAIRQDLVDNLNLEAPWVHTVEILPIIKINERTVPCSNSIQAFQTETGDPPLPIC